MSDNSAAKILLVDDNSKARKLRALMLLTHGYAVDTVGSLADLGRPWEDGRYGLVLLSMASRKGREIDAWKSIQRDHPAQGFMFVLSASQRLCPLFFNGDQIRDEELSDSFLQRVEAALSLV
ncbi:MAG TPA: response regulator [Terriglobales bacterium]|nr:response regulator [Terriglobales bacterium]